MADPQAQLLFFLETNEVSSKKHKGNTFIKVLPIGEKCISKSRFW